MFKKIAYILLVLIVVGIAFFAMMLHQRLDDTKIKSSPENIMSEEEAITIIFSEEFSQE